MTPEELKNCAVIDFETLPIRQRPDFPPPAISVAVHVDGESTYFSWGAQNGNTPDAWQEAHDLLHKLWASDRKLLFHNGLKFDIAVAEAEFGLPRLPWRRYDDTLPALFLMDPHAPNFKLKSVAERLLDEPPEEQDTIIEWLIHNQPLQGAGINLTRGKASKDNSRYAGGYVAYAPGHLCGKYAVGDVTRTLAIAEVVFPYLYEHEMIGPYEVEAELSPHLVEMEEQGVRVDVDALREDHAIYSKALIDVDAWLIERMGAPADINLNSGVQLAAAIIKAGLAEESGFGYTENSTAENPRMRTSREALEGAVEDKQFLAMLVYRSRVTTSLKTFITPWLKTAEASGGFIYASWNSTRTERGDGGGGAGARTGRFSSTPNLQNATSKLKRIFFDKFDRVGFLPSKPVPLPPLPIIRRYIVPHSEGHVLIGRDHSQQELRVLAHLSEGSLMQAYLDNNWTDLHQFATDEINKAQGTSHTRKEMKTVGFGLIYGMGLESLSKSLECSEDEARAVKASYLATFPGLVALYSETKARASRGEPIRTWGGREYHVEASKFRNGRLQTFEYKLPNVCIQGGAADLTKAGMLEYCRRKPKGHKLLLNIHDELLASVPRGEVAEGMEIMRIAMESPELDVPLLSEGYFCTESWANKTEYDTKGVLSKEARSF